MLIITEDTKSCWNSGRWKGVTDTAIVLRVMDGSSENTKKKY